MLKAEKVRKEFLRANGKTNVFEAVKETDFTLESGKLTVLTGRSGSGKTTFMNMLAGLLLPSGGKVILDDKDLYSLNDRELSRLRNTKIGYIPQGQTALQSLNVTENILLPFTLYNELDDNAKKYAENLMEELGIIDLKNTMPSGLSGGELRRMSIARALVRKPQIILADEPTGDLDDENTAIVFNFLKKSAQNGSAVLIVTHENDAQSYADKVFRMNTGTLEEVNN